MLREDVVAVRRIAKLLAVLAIAAPLAAPAMAASRSTTPPPQIRIPPAQIPSPPYAAPAIQPTPRALLPTDIAVVYDEDGTGLAMRGALTGKAESATGVVLAIFIHSEAFDPTSSSLPLVLADDGDRQSQALFAATIGGAPTIGVALVALDDAGGDATVFYDNADAFPASFPRLRQALGQSGSPAADTSAPAEDCGIPPVSTANTGWDALLAAAAPKDAENAIGPALAQALVDRLASDTGRPWRVVPLSDYR